MRQCQIASPLIFIRIDFVMQIAYNVFDRTLTGHFSTKQTESAQVCIKCLTLRSIIMFTQK